MGIISHSSAFKQSKYLVRLVCLSVFLSFCLSFIKVYSYHRQLDKIQVVDEQAKDKMEKERQIQKSAQQARPTSPIQIRQAAAQRHTQGNGMITEEKMDKKSGPDDNLLNQRDPRQCQKVQDKDVKRKVIFGLKGNKTISNRETVKTVTGIRTMESVRRRADEEQTYHPSVRKPQYTCLS